MGYSHLTKKTDETHASSSNPLASHPHFVHWGQLPSLLHDGYNYTRVKLGVPATPSLGYEELNSQLESAGAVEDVTEDIEAAQPTRKQNKKKRHSSEAKTTKAKARPSRNKRASPKPSPTKVPME